MTIDDESYIREDIIKRIKDDFGNNIEIVGEAASVKEAVSKINSLKPELLFLDINMDDGNGFDVVSRCAFKDFEIIFITGYDNHAIKAIKMGALDYIIKPIDDQEFAEAIEKVIASRTVKRNLQEQIDVSSAFYANQNDGRIVLKTLDTHYIVSAEDIVFCNSEGNYTTFYLKTDKITISKSLKKVEDLLSSNTFIKCHQSYLINRDYVSKYINDGFIITKFKHQIPVSTRRKEYVLSELF